MRKFKALRIIKVLKLSINIALRVKNRALIVSKIGELRVSKIRVLTEQI